MYLVFIAPEASAEGACILREMGYYCAVMIGYNLGVIMGYFSSLAMGYY